MTVNNKQNSNTTGLTYALETSPKTLPGTPVWIPLEPNDYADFGGELTTIARNPINASRQRKKGVVADLDASGGFSTDLTQTNMQDILQGFFFAALRPKGEAKNAIGISVKTIAVDSGTDKFTGDGSLDYTGVFQVGDIVQGAGFANETNNGIFKVATVGTGPDIITVTTADGTNGAATTVTEGANSDASLVVVGYETAVDDLDVDMTGDRPALTSVALDFADLNLIVGESIFVGGDETLTQFDTDANNGKARIRSIATNRIEFDKTASTWVTEAQSGLLIQVFFGRVLKNEAGALIVRRSYNLERTLGKADTTDTYDQAEYLEGAVPNEFKINIQSGSKVTCDLSFVAMDHTTIDSDTVNKSGTRPALVETDAFNTSSDFSSIKLAVFDETDANPTALYAFAQDLSITINNGIVPDKAVSVLGAFDVTAGNFLVGGDFNVYFSSEASIAAVRANSDVTLDILLVKSNAGISIDLPLITLGDARLDIELDKAIMMPLTNEAATGAKIDSDMDHTMMVVFFDYLPTLADV